MVGVQNKVGDKEKMKHIWYETFKLWSETKEYKDKVEESRRVISNAFTRYKNPYVAYSGGKDSIAMLHLVLQQKPEIDIWHFDHGKALMPREIEREIIHNAKLLGAKNLIIKTSKQLGKESARWDYKIWYNSFFGILNSVTNERGWDGVFLGLRQEESAKRKRKTKEFFSGNECYPLARWSWKDVWSYIVSNNLPYPSVYDRYAEVFGYDRARLVTFFDKEFEYLGAPYVDGILMPEFRYIDRKVKKRPRIEGDR